MQIREYTSPIHYGTKTQETKRLYQDVLAMMTFSAQVLISPSEPELYLDRIVHPLGATEDVGT